MNTYSIRTKDGIEITGIPENVPKDDQRLKDQVAQMRAQGQTSGQFGGRPAALAPASMPAPAPAPAPASMSAPAEPIAEPRAANLEPSTPTSRNIDLTMTPTGPQLDNALLRTMGGVVRGAGPIAAGAALGGAAGSVIPGVGTIAGATAGAGAMGLAQMAGDPIISGINSLFGTKYTLPTDALEDLFTRIGVAEPKTEAERFVQTVASGAAQAGGSVALGQALQAGAGLSPTTRALVGKALAEGPLQQVLGGAGSGAGAQIAANMGGGPLTQVGGALAGGIVGSALGGLRAGPPPTGPVSEAQRAGIDLMTSDIKPPESFFGRFAQSTAEKLPVVGTGGMRATQQSQRVSAVRDVLRQFGADDAVLAADDVMADLLSKRAGNLTRWTGMKQEVIDNIFELSPVPMDKTIAKIDDTISTLTQLKTAQNAPVIKVLEDWKQAIQGQSLQNIETLRKQVGDAFAAPELAASRSTGEKALSGIYDAVRQDMTDYIKAYGSSQQATKWGVANAELSKMAKELELPILKSTLDRGEQTPEVIANMLFSKKRSDVQALYNGLTAQGRASARSAILAKAAERAGGADISPDRFAAEVRRLGAQTGVFFSGDDLKQVQGLVRVLDATKRAAQASVMPATGVQAVIPASAAALGSYFGGGLSGFIGSMGAMAGIGGIARVYESPTVRNILMKIPTVRAGGPEEAALFKRLLEAAQAVQSTAAGGGAR